jgi:predicted nucleic acid-binding protein
MDKVLLDTDVILDFFFDRKPFSEHAAKVIGLCESGKIKGYVTAVIFSNIYYLLRQTANHEKVISNLKLLLSVTGVLVMDKEVVTNALNSDFKDFEDSLQNFSAMKAGDINTIITRNVKDFKTSKISIMSPESYLKSYNARYKK